MANIRNRICTVAIAFVLVFGVVALLNTDYSYAAAKPAKVTGIKISKSDSKIKISWKKSKNAKEYQVYRAASIDKAEDGKFSKIKTTSKTSCTIDLDKKGHIYVFKIRGVNGKTKGAFSNYYDVSIAWFTASKLEVAYTGGEYIMTNNTGKNITLHRSTETLDNKGEEPGYYNIDVDSLKSTGSGKATVTKDNNVTVIKLEPDAQIHFKITTYTGTPVTAAEIEFCLDKNNEYHYIFWNKETAKMSWKPSLFPSNYRTDY